MTLQGSCRCNNISLAWKNLDFSLVPRQCGCDYCSAKLASYVSKSGTAVAVLIRSLPCIGSASTAAGRRSSTSAVIAARSCW